MTRPVFYSKGLFLPALIALLLTACTLRGAPPSPSPNQPTPGTFSTTSSLTPPVATASLVPPSSTPVPLAAKVNGFPISLAEFQAQLSLYQSAIGKDPTDEDKKRVLNDLIDQALLAQAAEEKGFIVDDNLLQQRVQQLTSQLGGDQALSDWITKHNFNQDTFRQALSRSVAAAWMRDQIISALPRTAEQIHARQILLYNSKDAEDVLAQLKAGNDFGNLATKYDPVTNGDLGWFPRGFLLDQKLEQAAFSLQPGQYSSIIQTLAGFHILQVLERDPQRPLDPQALLTLQNQAVADWLQTHHDQSDIQVLLP